MEEFLPFIIIAIVGFLVFLLIRELNCWYFKINKRLEIQKMTLEVLLKLYEREGGDVNWEEVRKSMN